MNADGVGNNKFQPRQADTIVRQLRKIKCQLRIADVHGNFYRNVRHVVERNRLHFKANFAAINIAGVALTAANRERFALGDDLGCVLTADDRRNTELTGDDGSVTGTTAAIGDNRRCALHHRLPIGIRHVGDDHVAVFEETNL